MDKAQYRNSDRLSARAGIYEKFGRGRGRQPEMMKVTEAETLAGCIASIGTHSAASRAKLLAHVTSLVAAQGVVPISTQSGLFVARKSG